MRPLPSAARLPPQNPWRLLLGALMGMLYFLLLGDLGAWELAPTPSIDFVWPIASVVLAVLIAGSRWRNWLPIGAVMLLAIWAMIAATPAVGPLIRGLRVADPPAPCDAVVVLSSQVRPENDLPGEALSRLITGIELVRQGYAPVLVLTEIPPPAGSYKGAAEHKLEALRLDVPIEPIAGRVRNTHDEAVAVAALARERKWTQVLLVSSPLHLKRAQGAFSKQGVATLAYPAPNPNYSVIQPRGPTERLRAFADALHEWVGIFVYARRGWL